MADEPEDPEAGDEERLTVLIDRYRQLLGSMEVATIAALQGKIEDVVWYGPPGGRERPIFEEELEIVLGRGREARSRTGENPPDLLILCVGYSPEPLLLAIAHHAPAEVFLLIGKDLRPEYLESLKTLWDTYRAILGVPKFGGLDRRKVRDQAAEVFAMVRSITASRGPCRIVVDITGAKKSMIAGAFLAAGFLDLEASYVDFTEYDNLLRRPVPGTSRPGRIEHPYRLFRLREESRLHEELDRRQFREAERLAESLAGMAGSPEVAEVLGALESKAQEQRLKALGQVARGYALWREGFYQEAHAKLMETGLPIPATVAILAPAWPRSDDDASAIVQALAPQAVFGDPARALAYFLDVLVWNGEAGIAESPRDCYLRLYGTIESVLFFAFHVFVSRRPERLRVIPPETKEPDAHRFRLKAIQKAEKSSTLALDILTGKIFQQKKIGVAYEISSGPREFLKELQVKQKEFSDLRHKAVHWMAPVPKASGMGLLKFYESVLQQLIPQVVAHLRENGTELDAPARDRLDEWEGRLLAAVAGSIPADCTPLTYLELRDLTKT
jgi:hypothetical protein